MGKISLELPVIVDLLKTANGQTLHVALKAIQADLIDGQRDFETCRQMCQSLLENNVEPERGVLIGTALFNAARRVPEAYVEGVLAIADGTEALIGALPEEQRSKPMGILYYNKSVFARDSKQFDQAAEFARKSARYFEQAGMTSDATVSQFLVAVETANQAFFTDKNIEKAMVALKLAFEKAKDELEGTSWEVNVYLHMGLGLMWEGDQFYCSPLWVDTIMPFLRQLPEPTATNYAHWVRLFEAGDAFNQVNRDLIQSKIRDVIDRQSSDKNGDVTVTAMLLFATYEWMYGNPNKAREWLTQAAGWGGLKGGVPSAIALRPLRG